MKNAVLIFISIFIFFNNFVQAETEQVQHEILSIGDGLEVEFFMLKPTGDGPFPVIFLLHGYQPREASPGGKQLVDSRYLENFVDEGIVAVAISIPGYGNTTGKRDFGGKVSQKAVMAVIENVKKRPFIESRKMGIYGISRGAQLAALVSNRSPEMHIQILESGFYDVAAFCVNTPDYFKEIRNSIIDEVGPSPKDLFDRSPVYQTDSTKAVTLILQGEFDDRHQQTAAATLHRKLMAKGVVSQLEIFRNQLHVLSNDKWDVIIPFARKHLLNLYGIGIKVSDSKPAIQIAKIHPGSSAEKVGKLRIGDVVLRISPMNDQKEIDVLKMPVKKFTSYLQGKQGTSARLRVQHFDFSTEDIVIPRG